MRLFYLNHSLFDDGMKANEMRLRVFRLCKHHQVNVICVSGVEENRYFKEFQKEIEAFHIQIYNALEKQIILEHCVLTSHQLITTWNVFDGEDECAYLIDTEGQIATLYYLFLMISPFSCMIAEIKDELERFVEDALKKNHPHKLH